MDTDLVGLPIAVRKLWRAAALATSAFVGVVAGVAVGVARGPGLGIVAGVVATVVVGTMGWLLANLQFHAWRWGLTDRWIEGRWGVIEKHHSIVPRSRVQTVTTTNGPLDRWLGLTSIIIHTAGTHTPNLTIPHLNDDDVLRIQEELGR